MMQCFTQDRDGRLLPVASVPRCGWIHLEMPSEDEWQVLCQLTGLPVKWLALIQAQADDERSRLWRAESGCLLRLLEPAPNGGPVRSVCVLVAGDRLVTVGARGSALEPGALPGGLLRLAPGLQAGNALRLIAWLAQAYSAALRRIDADVIAAEAELARSYRNRELYVLLALNEDLIHLLTALRHLQHLLTRIHQGGALALQADEAGLAEVAETELRQAHAVVQISQHNLNSVMDAYGNIIQNNVSHVVKLLTALTIVLSIPTLIASIYGMNVPLPLQSAPSAFLWLMLAMLVGSLAVAWIFRRRHYF